MSVGFLMKGYEELIPGIAAWFGGLRFGGSVFKGDEEGTTGKRTAINLPLFGGVRFAPVWRYGLGVEAEVGADPLVLALTESGRWYQKIDLGRSVVYRAGIGPIEVSGTLGRRLRSEALYDDPSWWQD